MKDPFRICYTIALRKILPCYIRIPEFLPLKRKLRSGYTFILTSKARATIVFKTDYHAQKKVDSLLVLQQAVVRLHFNFCLFVFSNEKQYHPFLYISENETKIKAVVSNNQQNKIIRKGIFDRIQ